MQGSSTALAPSSGTPGVCGAAVDVSKGTGAATTHAPQPREAATPGEQRTSGCVAELPNRAALRGWNDEAPRALSRRRYLLVVVFWTDVSSASSVYDRNYTVVIPSVARRVVCCDRAMIHV